jgi:hypothetical protein
MFELLSMIKLSLMPLERLRLELESTGNGHRSSTLTGTSRTGNNSFLRLTENSAVSGGPNMKNTSDGTLGLTEEMI